MEPNNLQNNPNEEYNPNLDAQDEDVVSGGNNRLTYILLGVILALVVGYIALPKGQGSGIASVTPSFMLGDASVTGAVPPAEDSAAAKTDESSTTTAATTTVKTKTTAAPTTTTTTTTTAAPAAEPIAATEIAAAPAPAPEVAPAPAPAPAPAAPTTATLNGRIEDENGRPLAGATIFLKGTNKIASTDANGSYSIEVPANADNVLTYGYGGYDDETVTTHGNKGVTVTLQPRAKAGRKRR